MKVNRMTSLNRGQFDLLLAKNGFRFYNQFYEVWTKKYNITTLKERGFNALINNRVSWQLDYAMSFSHLLGVNVEDLFDFNLPDD